MTEQAKIGWSNRPWWYESFHLLTSMALEGVITIFGCAPVSCNDYILAESITLRLFSEKSCFI